MAELDSTTHFCTQVRIWAQPLIGTPWIMVLLRLLQLPSCRANTTRPSPASPPT
ncbi:hypothetical protein CJA_2860 [Cellvibrio japonicus Ueda107]|uniref:Uncharacterized protein n=1 Tax=Cellvibrio japonicus (strain Ueda107) TaxID=498211 RepID=B3PC47_CELJU|nr:hypothetical protein CJA_2860 [Cellvibrio japonicus Ueda107]